MTSLLDWVRGKAKEDGVEFDDEEFAREVAELRSELSADEPEGDVLSIDLPGEAAGAVELFLSRDAIGLDKPVEQDGLMWEPIIREGQWAVRPGGRTGKRRSPLKVVAGKSQNQRKEIGLQDIVDAFDDDAIEFVTVPTSHSNHVLENTGFIKGLKIAEGTVKPKRKDGDKPAQKVKVLMGGYDIKVPSVKEKMTLGTIASRSAGLLYDYVNTESGKSYPVALEHVALTNKPWITGMTAFGRKIKAKVGSTLDTVGLSLSNDEPEDEDFLANDGVLDGIELSDEREDLSWSKDESPNWLRQQVNQLLDQARAKKVAAMRKSKQDSGSMMYVDYQWPPNYRCVEAKPGSALIADTWGDDANFWSAPIEVKDGGVALTDFDKWQALKKDYVPDERPTPTKDQLPLEQETKTSGDEKLSRRELAVRARKARARGESNHAPAGASAAGDSDTKQPPRGGEHMAGQDEQRLSLSDEARQLIEAAEARAKAAEEKAEKLSRDRERDNETLSEMRADRKIDALKTAGFTEDKAFGGLLAYARNVYLADDGEPALQSEHFADDNNKTGELTLSQVVDGFFAAFKRADDGKLLMGEQLSQPPEGTEKPETPEEAAAKEKLSDGKPGGKENGSEETPFAELSREEQDRILAEELADTPLAGMIPVPKGADA